MEEQFVEKDPETGYVRVLFIQPVEMKDMVARVQPTVFQNDTTFGTNAEGYKLFVPVYHSTVTDKSEFAVFSSWLPRQRRTLKRV